MKVKFTTKLKKQWVKALRSGKYKQGTGQLSRGRGKSATYCCLGVLNKIAGTRFKGYLADLSDGDGQPRLLTFNRQIDLQDMNDEQGLSFKEIANYVQTKVNVRRDGV
jgi:hypothetical protein